MANFVEAGARYLYPGDCYNTVWTDFNFLDEKCFKLFISRSISLTIVGGAAVLKLPQVLKVVTAGSVEGLSLMAVLLEMACYLFTFTYNYAKAFPFSTYGESLFLTIQVILVAMLIFYYQRRWFELALFGPVMAGVMYVLCSGLASLEVLAALQSSGIPLLIASRSTQIMTTYRAKSTGQLSFISAFMLLGGSFARVFTTIQETNDMLMLISFLVGLTLNAIIMLQFVVYWNAGKRDDEKKKKKQ